MPSPFPGMDPYLEGDLWTTVHAQLAVEIVRQLAPRLRPRYVALNEKCFVVDTGVTSRVPHTWVKIRDTAKRRLVSVIEFLSPTNKRGEGRKEYLERRRKILLSSVHLLEIDLLRRGQRLPMREPLPSAAYCIFLSRAGKRPLTEVWPIALDQPLPTVPVPLLKGDPDQPLELGRALTNVYDSCSYDLAIDYRRPPEVPLKGEALHWSQERLRGAGIRWQTRG